MAPKIQPINPDSSQYGHVIKHLYAREETWELAIPDLPDCHAESRAAGCGDGLLNPGNRHAYARACPECRACVLGHHDRYYAPAYFAAIDTYQESLPVLDGCTAFVGKNGVFAIVSRAHFVRTAYRVVPIGPAGGVTGDDFIEAAHWHLRDLAMRAVYSGESKMTIDATWQNMTEADLEALLRRFHDGSLTAAQTYRLLVLLGRRAQFGASPRELAALLGRDDLGRAISALRAHVHLPDMNELLGKLRSDLDDEEEPQGALFGSLINIDNLATLWELFGQPAIAENLVRRAATLTARFPDRTQSLTSWALRRVGAIQSPSVLTPLWQTVAQESSAAEHQLGVWTRLVSLLDWSPITLALQPRLAAPLAQVEPYGRAWFDCYKEGEELIVQVLHSVGQHVRGTPRLWVASAAGTRSSPVPVKLEKKDSVWLSLGTEAQLSAMLAKLREELGAEAAQIESISLQVELEGDKDVQPQN